MYSLLVSREMEPSALVQYRLQGVSGPVNLKYEVKVNSGIPEFQSQTNNTEERIANTAYPGCSGLDADGLGMFTRLCVGQHGVG